jgi:osmoprotectant transport system substrate-binding protein
MAASAHAVITRLLGCAVAGLAAASLAGCGGSTSATVLTPSSASSSTSISSTTTQTTALPGTGKPQVTIGDKNYTEQFVLGQLYYQALQAQGFPVLINQNIGPTEVTLQALHNGQLGLYPEYLDTWNSQVAGYGQNFKTPRSAYIAAQRYALQQGLELLDPTPFSDTSALGVTVNFAQQNRLRTIGDLRKLDQTLTVGVPPQFEQDPAAGLPALEGAYAFTPAAVKALEIGSQYQALDQNTVQAADVNTTDGELTTGNYWLLSDPQRVLGVGNVVPVVTSQVLDAEGPAFAATVNRVSALLTLPVIRELNAQVDLWGQDPATVAKRFLVDHGVIPAPH